jgi:hypothetical protein
LAITCQKLESEREVSFVSMYPMWGRLHRHRD